MTTVASVWTNAQFIDGTAIKGHALGLKIAAGNVPSFVDLANRRVGRNHPGPAQQRPDADDGQLRHAGRPVVRLRHAGDGGCMRQAFRGRHAPEGQRPDRHADGGAVDRPLSMVSARAAIHAAGRVLSDPCRQDHARGTVHAVPELPAERLGAAAQVRRRRLSRRRQGDVRQRRQPLGRRQLHRRLAGAGRSLAGQRDQVRARMASRSRRSPPASLAAGCRAAPSAPRSMPTTTLG